MAHPTRIFKKTEDLQDAWLKFKKDLDKQKGEWLKTEFVGKEGRPENVEPVRIPMTLEGFKRFCRERKEYGDIHNYFENTEGRYNDFKGICSHIREEIRENQIIGGLLGVYNPSITQRLNGLAEKSEVTGKIEQPLFGPKE